jgi:hypothetical protein
LAKTDCLSFECFDKLAPRLSFGKICKSAFVCKIIIGAAYWQIFCLKFFTSCNVIFKSIFRWVNLNNKAFLNETKKAQTSQILNIDIFGLVYSCKDKEGTELNTLEQPRQHSASVLNVSLVKIVSVFYKFFRKFFNSKKQPIPVIL